MFLVATQLSAQEGIRLNSNEAMKGYLLFETQFSTFLVDNCGDIVHEWPGVASTDLHNKLQEDGLLRYIENNEKTLVLRDWDNNIVKSYFIEDPNLFIVYEALKKPNGNFLCVTRRYLTDEEFEDIGYDISRINDFSHDPRRMDGVIEIDAQTGQVIWEWSIRDHVIQQRDPSAPNYGILADNPQLLNIDAIIDTYDWNSGESFMINGFDYNPELEQLALSVRKMGEVVIIDQSTTTEQAKGSTGGNSGMGGDILYRFGNPQNYDRGTAADRILYYQHNPNWIQHGPHKGKLICYNNGLDRPDVVNFEDRYSSVPIFDPIEDGFKYQIEPGQAYAPLIPEVQYNRHTTNTHFYSSYTSGARVMPNGNIFITEGVDGVVFEINVDGEKVWEYDCDEGSGAYLFRSERYPEDYPALIGKDLSSTGATVEFPPSSYDCDLTVSTTDILDEKQKLIFKKIDNRYIEVVFPSGKYKADLISIDGKWLDVQDLNETNKISIEHLNGGVYFIKVSSSSLGVIDSYKFYK